MPPYYIMKKIRTIEVKDSITHYDEIIEKIIIFPQVNEVEITLSRQFKNNDDKVVKTESSVETIKSSYESEDIEKKIIKLIKRKKGIL